MPATLPAPCQSPRVTFGMCTWMWIFFGGFICPTHRVSVDLAFLEMIPCRLVHSGGPVLVDHTLGTLQYSGAPLNDYLCVPGIPAPF